jgi:hypothetical protein
VHTGSDLVALLAGAATGATLAMIFGVLVIWLNTNQYATGLALSLFGAGFSAFIGISYTQEKLTDRVSFAIPGLAKIPVLGPAFFNHHPLVYFALALAVALHLFLQRSRTGLSLRAVGESPESAHALGFPVRRWRLAAVMIGGALILARVPKESMVDLNFKLTAVLFGGGVAGVFLIGFLTTRVNYACALLALGLTLLFELYLVLCCSRVLPSAISIRLHWYWVGVLTNLFYMFAAYSLSWLAAAASHVFPRQGHIARSSVRLCQTPAAAQLESLTVWSMAARPSARATLSHEGVVQSAAIAAGRTV